MHESIQQVIASSIEPWPVGWPLPLTAMCPSLRWEDVVEVYLAFCEAFGTESDGPAAGRTAIPATRAA